MPVEEEEDEDEEALSLYGLTSHVVRVIVALLFASHI